MIIHPKNKEEIEKLLLSDKIVLDFFASWCGPCRMLSETIENVCKNNEEIKIIKIDVDQYPGMAEVYHIQAVPTLILIEKGKLVKSSVGNLNEKDLKKFLNL